MDKETAIRLSLALHDTAHHVRAEAIDMNWAIAKLEEVLAELRTAEDESFVDGHYPHR